MNIKRIVVGMVFSLFIAAPTWAQSNNVTITNTDNGSAQQGFGFSSSFSFQDGGVSITQDISNDSIDQCFSVVTEMWRIVQYVIGNDIEQTFLAPDADDPCF